MKNHLLLAIVFCLVFLSPRLGFCYEEGQLYWLLFQDENGSPIVTQEFSYDENAVDMGADAVLNYGCNLDSGGNYADEYSFDSGENLTSFKGAHCMNHPSLSWIPYLVPGKYYIARLYCNGELRDKFADLGADPSPCLIPEPGIEIPKNLGFECN